MLDFKRVEKATDISVIIISERFECDGLDKDTENELYFGVKQHFFEANILNIDAEPTDD